MRVCARHPNARIIGERCDEMDKFTYWMFCEQCAKEVHVHIAHRVEFKDHKLKRIRNSSSIRKEKGGTSAMLGIVKLDGRKKHWCCEKHMKNSRR